MTVRALAGLTVLTALAVTACGQEDSRTSGEPSVVASFYPLAFVAEHVAGDHAAVENLTEPGVESHDLELTVRQTGTIADADLVLYLHGFQPAVDDAVAQNAAETSLDVADVVALPEDHHGHDAEPDGDQHDHGGPDPHVWLDPVAMRSITEAVAERLIQLDPDHAADYRANAQALTAELDELDTQYSTVLDHCERRVIVVAHEAFGHLAGRYGLEQVGIAGPDPDAEPSPERLAAVHDLVAEENVTTIFHERLVSPAVVDQLAADVGATTAVLDPIEGLTDETADEDYLSLMHANLTALGAANGCAPIPE